MGYDATFEGEFRVSPPLAETERARLRAFARERHEDPAMPGYWCHWIPSEDGAALAWNGSEKFYRSAAWLRYLITHFLRPAGHLVGGRVTATGQDGAVSQIVATRNRVRTVEVRGPAPAEFSLLIQPRHRDPELAREYDAAFDHGRHQFAKVLPDSPELRPTAAAFAAAYAPLCFDEVDDRRLVDDRRGLTLEFWDDGTMHVRLLASVAMRDPERTFAEAVDFAVALAAHLNWIVWDPAQRAAVRPTARFRQDAIDTIQGYLDYEQVAPRRSVV